MASRTTEAMTPQVAQAKMKYGIKTTMREPADNRQREMWQEIQTSVESCLGHVLTEMEKKSLESGREREREARQTEGEGDWRK
jgi:imidazolonepropionase-like amidohydrolase